MKYIIHFHFYLVFIFLLATLTYYLIVFSFVLFALPHDLQDLSSLTRD